MHVFAVHEVSAMKTGRRNHGKGHSYLLDGEKVPSVTAILKGIPKPALTTWAAKAAASYAIDNWDELASLPMSTRFEQIKRAPWSQRDAAAARGTQVHDLAERLTRGEEVEVPDHIAGHVDACVQFLDDYDVQPLVTEQPVFSRKHKYAGTPDLFAIAGGAPRLVDYKTAQSGIWGETAIQCALYRYAEFWIDDEGSEQPIPEVDGCWGVWIRADGYDVYPLTAGPAQFRQALYAAQVCTLLDELRDLVGPALTPPRRELSV